MVLRGFCRCLRCVSLLFFASPSVLSFQSPFLSALDGSVVEGDYVLTCGGFAKAGLQASEFVVSQVIQAPGAARRSVVFLIARVSDDIG